MPTDFRPALAALLVLAGLAGAYEGARRLPPAPGARRLAAPAVAALATSSEASSRVVIAGPVLADTLRPPTPPPTPPASSPRSEEPAEELPKCRPQPLRFAEKRTFGPRRYVGTVGGEPATAEIYREENGRLAGRFYCWRTDLEYTFVQVPRRPRVLELAAAEWCAPGQAGGQWRLARAPGPVLQGTWVDSAGRRPRPFVLRESYRGGVRYEIRKLTMTGGQAQSHNSCDVPTCSRDFLHLLGPAARQPPLSRVQCPPLAARRRQLHQEDYSPEMHTEYYLHVLLNDFQLLSYEVYHDDMPFEGTSGGTVGNVLLDLATGRPLTVVSQLRPGYEQPLRRLLGARFLKCYYQTELYQLRAGFDPEWTTEHGRDVLLAPLPHEASGDDPDSSTGMGLAAQGLAVAYSFSGYHLLIPYAELRPLVRPGTPLARMLRARGLW